jgi:hypothetical protein
MELYPMLLHLMLMNKNYDRYIILRIKITKDYHVIEESPMSYDCGDVRPADRCGFIGLHVTYSDGRPHGGPVGDPFTCPADDDPVDHHEHA